MTAVTLRRLPRQSASAARPLAEPGPLPSELRWTCAARACYGAALLVVPGRLIAAVTGHVAGGRACAVARALGARHLIQAASCGLIPARALVAAGTIADGLHLASMLVLAGVAPDVRRAVLADIAAETVLASAGARALRREPSSDLVPAAKSGQARAADRGRAPAEDHVAGAASYVRICPYGT